MMNETICIDKDHIISFFFYFRYYYLFLMLI